ncbi:MAG: MFS transporter [Alphaproteobacteria bacterium]|nr:MFS transporter [Alphaproteobacteria bacterium]
MMSVSLAMWRNWSFITLFYAYQYIVRVLPNIIYKPIVETFGINATIFGQFSGIYYIGYALAHIPVSLLFDRFGLKKVLPLTLLLMVGGLLPIIYTESWIYPVFGRFLTGIGSASVTLAAFHIIRVGFPVAKHPMMLSLTIALGLVGAVYGGRPTAYLCDQLGHVAVIQILVAVGSIISVISYISLPKEKNRLKDVQILKGLKHVFCNKNTMWMSLTAGLMIGSLEGFPDAWGVMFFTKVYGLQFDYSAQLTSLIFLGLGVGGPLVSYAAEKTGKALWFIIIAGICMAVPFLFFLGMQLSDTMLIVSLITIGVGCSYQMLSIYHASYFVEKKYATISTAVVNMILMGFGHLLHSAIGCTVNISGGLDNVQALKNGLYVVPLASLLGAIILIIRRKYFQNLKS